MPAKRLEVEVDGRFRLDSVGSIRRLATLDLGIARQAQGIVDPGHSCLAATHKKAAAGGEPCRDAMVNRSRASRPLHTDWRPLKNGFTPILLAVVLVVILPVVHAAHFRGSRRTSSRFGSCLVQALTVDHIRSSRVGVRK
ncbi:Transcriptional regulator, LysR family [Pseudomonas chlororaphis subsp. aurantiaca]|nr:Transcriptional regulator, LysR family [Pseudomonas chlororaphis subsp. aurantiaca]AZD43400.1 Transcriptional regulator, LysR family [Pseudomonas chlororaphis subsp. aurantiaca]